MAMRSVPDATVYRLALYHCYLGELLRTGAPERVTSRQLAEELDIKEETVRRDISFVGDIGRPGAGYSPQVLFDEFTRFLGLGTEYPIIMVGSAEMLRALEVVFPPDKYGVRPVGFYSEQPQDVGCVINGLEVKHLTELSRLDPALHVNVALVAVSPSWVQITIDLLAAAGVTGVLLMTPAIKVKKPEGLTVTQIRMPCDIKSLACRCQPQAVTAEVESES